jgi:ribosomal protein L22
MTNKNIAAEVRDAVLTQENRREVPDKNTQYQISPESIQKKLPNSNLNEIRKVIAEIGKIDGKKGISYDEAKSYLDSRREQDAVDFEKLSQKNQQEILKQITHIKKQAASFVGKNIDEVFKNQEASKKEFDGYLKQIEKITRGKSLKLTSGGNDYLIDKYSVIILKIDKKTIVDTNIELVGGGEGSTRSLP